MRETVLQGIKRIDCVPVVLPSHDDPHSESHDLKSSLMGGKKVSCGEVSLLFLFFPDAPA